jgi:hypothetical protein
MKQTNQMKKSSISELVRDHSLEIRNDSNKSLKVKEDSLKISRPLMSLKRVRYVYEKVPEQYSFFLHDGKVLRNLNDLIISLDAMSDDIYNFHANSSKNDFSNWVRDIIGEPELSLGLLSKNRMHAKAEIINFLRKRGSFRG